MKNEDGEHARPGRSWTRPRVQHVVRETYKNAWEFSVRPGFPRGREKPHPGRVRSLFSFGVWVKNKTPLQFSRAG